ncbi:DUF6177 family protein, partial [Streptomyces sp. NPDC059786]|uniref:DUF6177 family protein n=1 Tax=Streptomyces sp. NPDC059786 TaxID=3346946 RepID=UPI003653CC2B
GSPSDAQPGEPTTTTTTDHRPAAAAPTDAQPGEPATTTTTDNRPAAASTGGRPGTGNTAPSVSAPSSATLSSAGLPAVDVLTGSTAVVLIDRPVVALTSWLSDVLRAVSGSRRALQIVTPPHVRLSPAARATLAQAPNRWIVQDPECGYYDGLSGAVLRWQDGTFTPALTAEGKSAVAKAFAPAGPTAERQLLVALRTLRPADEHLVLGGALETAWRVLTGDAPAGWGTAEPVNLPWSPRQLTDLARGRAPEPTHLLAVGGPDRPAFGSVRVTRTAAGVQEEMHLALGHGAHETLPLDAVRELAGTLVSDHALATMLVSVRHARRDLTAPAHLEALPVPYALTLGPRDVGEIGLDHARRPPVALRPATLGPASRPALHYPLGEPDDTRNYDRLRDLTAHLKSSPATG